jgi:hypothetical protein
MATNSFDLGGLLFGGGDNGLNEYLNETQREAIQRQALLQAAGAFLQAGGPSTQRISFGQALGGALQAGSKGYGEAQQSAINQLLTKQKMDEYKMAQDQRRRLEQIFGAQAPVAGMPMTPQQALAAPGGQAGPTVERAAMVGQVPEAAAVSPEDMRYDQYMKAAQLYAASDPAKSKAYMDQALLIKPKAEVTGDIFTAKDGRQYQRTKTGQFIPIPTGMEFAQETVGEPFKAADGKYYLRTKTGGFVLAEKGLAAKPVGQPQQVMGADGKPSLVQMYDDGTYKPVTGVSPLIPPEKIDTGGGVRFVNPYEVKPGTVFPKTLAPQVVGGAETGYYVVGGGGGRGAMPGAPASQPTPAAAPSRRGPPMPGAPAPVTPAAAGPQPIIPGTGKTPPQDFLTKSYGIQNTNDAVNNFIGVVSNFKSSDMVDPNRRAELSSAHSRAMLYAKELFNLGVLTGGDEVILNKVLMNPVDFSTAAVPIEAVRKQAEDLKKVIQSSAANLSKTYKQPALELNKYEPPKAQGITEGAESVSKSGKPIVYRNGAWEYK